jgi:hypothetical protein
MTLTQSGANVIGEVSEYFGVVEGVAQGNKLEGIFRTDKNLAPIDCEFSFTMSDDWMSWEGYVWNVGDKEKDPRIYWTWMQGVRVDLPFVVNVETDKTTYEQGDAVTVNIQVLYNKEPHPPNDLKIAFEVEAPNGGFFQGSVFTDQSGKYSMMPFAGYMTGMYKLSVNCAHGPELEKIVAMNMTSFKVETESLVGVDQIGQLNKIIELYKAQIPEGPIRGPGFGEYRVKYPESMYGSLHNLFIAGKWADPERNFACGGYQEQVLAFFDSIRFNKDPEVRKLLNGFDYGPISRGRITLLHGHNAVLLYVSGKEWSELSQLTLTRNSWVFDPWPTQSPKICSLTDFSGGFGEPEPDIFTVEQTHPMKVCSGYPLTGGVVYTNWKWMGINPKSPLPPKSSIVVNCPVNVLVTNSQGQRAGTLSDGTKIQEFPAYIYQTTENNETIGWYFGVFEGVHNIVITGQSTGTFELLISGDAAGGHILDYGNQPITKGDKANVTIGISDYQPLLALPDGKTVRPQIIEFDASSTPTPTPTSTNPPNGPCIIATATYGGPFASEVVFMRSVRDDLIGSSPTGSVLVKGWNSFYYSWSPPLANVIAGSVALKTLFSALLAPLLGSMYVVAGVYNGLALISPDLAALASFILAAVLSTSIYILLPAAAIRYIVRFAKNSWHRHNNK